METFIMNTEQLQDELLSQSDGPVTKYIAIRRAIQLASENRINDGLLADALYNALEYIEKNGELQSNEF